MTAPIKPDPELRKKIESSVKAESQLCWTCGACLGECPVNIATNRLSPQKVVRFANYGMMSDLLLLPEVWYCLTCRRCRYVCPMSVKPSEIISYARQEAVMQNYVSHDAYRQYRDLFGCFQRVRWRAADACRNNDCLSEISSNWNLWFNSPVKPLTELVKVKNLPPKSIEEKKAAEETGITACMTCCECSSYCPLSYERSVFDPVSIFRMINIGMTEELLKSPYIWLCLSCQRCTEACSQLVRGHMMIENLRIQAIEQGYADKYFPGRWLNAGKALYPPLIRAVDELFGFNR